jgi:hypothetical protein
MDPIKIIYFIGTGHSGSTLLDIILGAHPQGVAVGELIGISRWLQNELKINCSCGQNMDNCEFWSHVFETWGYRVGKESVSEYSALQSFYERSSLLSLISRMFYQKQFYGSSKASKYFQLSAELYNTLIEVGGVTFIIDSSKNLVKALSLSKNPHVDLYLIHLVRDPRAVANSYYKFNLGNKENWGSKMVYLLRMALMWILYNLLCEFILTRMEKEKCIQILYEDLVREPQKVLERIGGIVEKNYLSVAKKLMSGEALSVGHVVGGNQKLRTRQITMVKDNKWKKELSKTHQGIIWSITGIFARRYRFK